MLILCNGMRYIWTIPFIGFAIAEVLIPNLNRKASVKRKAFRWCIVLSALSFLIVMPLTGLEIELLIFVTPVLALMVWVALSSTKFCEWCGKVVRTNLPFIDKEHCPRCGSMIK